jgi:hypothetical protein
LDANLVARHELGEIGTLEFVGQALHYGMDGHSGFLLMDSEL